jgi:orotidine-5'-phosphate decarboxylase
VERGNFGDRLAQAVQRRGTFLTVGLDPRSDQLPEKIRNRYRLRYGCGASPVARAVEEFSCQVLEVVRDLVPAVKVQAAFFELLGPPGFAALQRVLRRARALGFVTILDAKRGDIGSTAWAYAEAALAPATTASATPVWEADAVTVNPYLGPDSLEPFVELAQKLGKGVFLLVRSSNPGAQQLQEQPLAQGVTVAELVARWAEEASQRTAGRFGFGPVGAVVGGTAGPSLARLREVLRHAWLLVPGYGAQGATASEVTVAVRSDGLGALVSSSRQILAGARKAEQMGLRWQDGVRQATLQAIRDLQAALATQSQHA